MKSCLRTRRVTKREGYEIAYTDKGAAKTCWISTWMEWAREAKVIKSAGLFDLPRKAALALLSKMEKNGTLAAYVKEHHPDFIDPDGQVMKFTLGIKLGLIEV